MKVEDVFFSLSRLSLSLVSFSSSSTPLPCFAPLLSSPLLSTFLSCGNIHRMGSERLKCPFFLSETLAVSRDALLFSSPLLSSPHISSLLVSSLLFSLFSSLLFSFLLFSSPLFYVESFSWFPLNLLFCTFSECCTMLYSTVLSLTFMSPVSILDSSV